MPQVAFTVRAPLKGHVSLMRDKVWFPVGGEVIWIWIGVEELVEANDVVVVVVVAAQG